jgi:hypothetical protein
MSLFQSNFSKSLITVAGTIGLLTVFVDAAGAFGVTFNNGGFENSTSGWSTIGDVTTNGGINGVNPIGSNSQAIITNSYINSGTRNDNNGWNFNQSGTNPVDADTISNGSDLQTHLGLGINALSIDRSPAVPGFPRTSKEGSGMFQDITINITADDVAKGKDGFILRFNWAYLTNDGKDNTYGLGNQDYSFVSIYNTNSPSDAITLLGDSSQTISTPNASNDYAHSTTNYYTSGNRYSQSFSGLGVGNHTYRVGFGVVDVDGVDRSSALLLDEFGVQEIPFEFSPSLGIFIVAGMVGCDRLRRKFKSNSF